MRFFNSHRRWRSSRKREVPTETQILRQKFLFIKLLIVTLFAVLALQLARMQIVQGNEYRLRAENNRLREVPEVASRGLIYDRNGTLLVENVPSFSAAVVPADLPPDEQQRVLEEVQKLLGVPALKMAIKIEAERHGKDPFSPVVIEEGLSQETAFALREKLGDLPGVRVLAEPIRRYPAGPLMGQILGYVGKMDEAEYADLQERGYLLSDQIGKTGVELSYESVLRGAPGRKQVEIDARGAEVRTLRLSPAKPGENLILTIDLDLQREIADILQSAMDVHGSQNGAAVLMDVNTGEILAMVSLPFYDNNLFSGDLSDEEFQSLLDDPGKPLVNHAISEMFPPGSTFKQVTGVAALAEGVADPSTTITSHGYITVPNQYNPDIVYVYRDWSALGTLDFYGGVAMSSDVYFYYLSGGYYEDDEEIFHGLGADNLARYAREFGLGAPTGVDLPGESAGLVPDPAWKEETIGEPWVIGDTYNFGIGQGYLATTPLQMVNVTATIANGGDVLVPRVVREIVSADGKVMLPSEPKIRQHIDVDAEDLSIFREAMHQAVSWGTAERAAVPGVSVAGKTGTAEFGPPLPDGEHESHAWFTGFAPYEDPQVAIVVFLEKGNGSLDAAPTAARILDYYFHRQSLAGAPTEP
jgi:penicillin-binding protein 2